MGKAGAQNKQRRYDNSPVLASAAAWYDIPVRALAGSVLWNLTSLHTTTRLRLVFAWKKVRD
jgi:hypothetical protein